MLRAGSVSSIRSSIQSPKARLATADSALPTCSVPVGLGAKRTRVTAPIYWRSERGEIALEVLAVVRVGDGVARLPRLGPVALGLVRVPGRRCARDSASNANARSQSPSRVEHSAAHVTAGSPRPSTA